MVTDAKVMRQVLTDHRTFNKGWVYSEKFAVGFGEGLVTIQSGDHHKADRVLIQRFFIKGFLEVRLHFSIKAKPLQFLTKYYALYVIRQL